MGQSPIKKDNKVVIEKLKVNLHPNDQAEPLADRDRSSYMKAGEVGKWSHLHNKCGWKYRLNLRLNQLLDTDSPIVERSTLFSPTQSIESGQLSE